MYDSWTAIGAIPADHAVLLRDINGDAADDLIDAAPAGGAVQARVSDGTTLGSARPAADLPLGFALDSGDVDSDLKSDLVIVSALSGEIRVALANMATPTSDDESPWTPDPSIVYDNDDASLPADPDPAIIPDDPVADPVASAASKPRMRLAFQDERLLSRRADVPDAAGNPIPTDAAYGSREGEALTSLDRIYKRLREAGGGRLASDPVKPKAKPLVRFIVYWGRHENKKKADGTYHGGKRYEFERLKRDVQLAKANGFDVYMTITGYAQGPGECPTGPGAYNPNGRACAAIGGSPTGINPTASEVDEFASFAGEVVKTFKDDVGAYGVWNEPNNPDFLRTANRKQIPAELYGQIYRKAYSAIKAQQSSARVFIGELSYIGKRDMLTGTPKRRPLVTPSVFLERTLRSAGPGTVTHGVAWHPYQVIGTPTAPNKNGGEEGIGRVAKIQRKLDDMYKLKVGGKRLLKTPKAKNPPLYFTEFGYFNQRPRLKPNRVDKWQTEITKSKWMRLALTRAYRSRARWMLLYQAAEFPPDPVPAEQEDEYAKPPRDDYGLFSARGEVTGTRPYGKGRRADGKADPTSAKYPQTRLTYCNVYKWARAAGYSNLASSSFGSGSFDKCP